MLQVKYKAWIVDANYMNNKGNYYKWLKKRVIVKIFARLGLKVCKIFKILLPKLFCIIVYM